VEVIATRGPALFGATLARDTFEVIDGGHVSAATERRVELARA
jgi:hypothetical protein